MWTLLLLLGAAPPISPSDAEALARREVVVRVDDRESGASLVALVRVSAPPDRVLEASMDVERLAGIGNVASLEVYDRGPDHVSARVDARALGMDWVYHVVYRADRAHGRVDYALDPSRPNDLARLEGSYEFIAVDGGTLVVNRASGDTGRWVPAGVRRWVVARGMREKLEIIRTVAEGPPS